MRLTEKELEDLKILTNFLQTSFNGALIGPLVMNEMVDVLKKVFDIFEKEAGE